MATIIAFLFSFEMNRVKNNYLNGKIRDLKQQFIFISNKGKKIAIKLTFLTYCTI